MGRHSEHAASGPPGPARWRRRRWRAKSAGAAHAFRGANKRNTVPWAGSTQPLRCCAACSREHRSSKRHSARFDSYEPVIRFDAQLQCAAVLMRPFRTGHYRFRSAPALTDGETSSNITGNHNNRRPHLAFIESPPIDLFRDKADWMHHPTGFPFCSRSPISIHPSKPFM